MKLRESMKRSYRLAAGSNDKIIVYGATSKDTAALQDELGPNVGNAGIKVVIKTDKYNLERSFQALDDLGFMRE